MADSFKRFDQELHEMIEMRKPQETKSESCRNDVENNIINK